MRAFQWTRAYSVYVAEVDAEHRTIFRLAHGLHQATAGGAAWRKVQPLLRELVAHTAGHLSHEEHVMRSTGYPLYEWHTRQHNVARAKISHLDLRIRRGDRESVPVLLDYLAGWLENHIRLADRMLGAYLRNRERAEAALAS